jgi:hypothetical protein
MHRNNRQAGITVTDQKTELTAVSYAFVVRIVFWFALLLIGCDQSFNPKAELRNQLVVFSVLSNDRDLQFVRVASYYDVSGFDASENKEDPSLKEAKVSITGSSGVFAFRDTVLPRLDTDRYSLPINAFVATAFRAEPGKRYDLLVTCEGRGTAASSLTLPDRPLISLYPGELVLQSPSSFDPRSRFSLRTTLSPFAKGSLCQLFIDYQVLEGWIWKDGRVEVPYEINLDTLGIWDATYPKLTRVTGNATGVSFKVWTYTRMLQKTYQRFEGKKLVMTRAVLRVFECEQGYYDYLNTVNGFKDNFSIRTDQPEYTNIKGGAGVFGAYTVDSLVYPLPTDWRTSLR